jgi:DNA (cytosine-5)-methyltransferase 1
MSAYAQALTVRARALAVPDRPNGLRILDLCSKAGGAGFGYHLAGFEVTGVDLEPQPRYPFGFVQADALDILDTLIRNPRDPRPDAVHVSPPCQLYSLAQRIRGNDHPDLIGPFRDRLRALGLPYVIENVPGAPLADPVTLCGAMFPGLQVYRHREFETSFPAKPPVHPVHAWPLAKMGRPPGPGDFMHVVGNFSGAQAARQAMGISWMTRDELREAIPPAYTRHIGRALAAALTAGKAAA